MNIKKNGVNVYHVAWKILDSRRFGLPQRRRRLYILGSPWARKPPKMKSKSMKMKPLTEFLSQGRKKEKYPRHLDAEDNFHPQLPDTTFQWLLGQSLHKQ